MLVAFVVSWALFSLALVVVARRYHIERSALIRVLPDTIRLLRELVSDRSLPRGVRRRLALAVVYCVQPFNVIPDFVPVIGFADNVAVACLALRSVIRLAGPEPLLRHWKGSPETLVLLCRTLRVPLAQDSSADAVTPRGEERLSRRHAL
jgi:uncharacterized membrane protein YkvA (DUF1232 family)